MDWERNRILSVGKNSGPIKSCLWTNVHEILDRSRRPFELFNALVWSSMTCFIQKIFAKKSRSRRKPNNCISFLGPKVLGGTTPTFLRHVVSAIYFLPFGKVWSSSVGWPLYAKPGNDQREARTWLWYHGGQAKWGPERQSFSSPSYAESWLDATVHNVKLWRDDIMLLQHSN